MTLILEINATITLFFERVLSHDPTGPGRELQGRYVHIYFLKRAFHTDRITWQPDIIIIIIALP